MSMPAIYIRDAVFGVPYVIIHSMMCILALIRADFLSKRHNLPKIF